MRNFRLFARAFALCAALAFAACGSDDTDPNKTDPKPGPGPGPQPELTDAYRSGETTRAIKSKFYMDDGDLVYLFLSPDEVATLEELIAEGAGYEFISVFVAKELLGQEIDATKASGPDWGLIWLHADGTESYDSLNENDLKKGSILMEADQTGKKMSVSFSLERAAGTLFEGQATVDIPAGPEPMPLDNAYKADDKEVAIQTMFTMNSNGLIYLLLSPDAVEIDPALEDMDNYYNILDATQNLIVMVISPAIIGQTVDMMAAEAPMWQMQVALPEIQIEGLSPGSNLNTITEGTLRVAEAEGKLNVYSEMTHDTGVKFAFGAAAPFAGVPEPANFFEKDGMKKEIKSAFMTDEGTGVSLYLTTADISDADHPDEMWVDVNDKIEFHLANALVDGNVHQVTELGATDRIVCSFGYGEEVYTAGGGGSNNVTGTFSVERDPADNTWFVVAFEFDLGGKSFKGAFEGYADPFVVESVNEYGNPLEADKKPVGSALVDFTKTPVEIWIAEEEGLTTVEAFQAAADPVKIVVPEEKMTGDPVGFSAEPQAAIVYKNTIYNSQSGGCYGTIYVMADPEFMMLEFALMRDMAEGMGIETFLEGYYEGPITAVGVSTPQ